MRDINFLAPLLLQHAEKVRKIQEVRHVTSTCIGALEQWFSRDTVAVCPLANSVALNCSCPAPKPGLLRICTGSKLSAQPLQRPAVEFPDDTQAFQ